MQRRQLQRSGGDQAVYSTTYSVLSAGYVQNNTGSPVSYPTFTNTTLAGYPCPAVYVSAIAYEGVSSSSPR